ncbi:MAG: flagellar basal-body MS-ring/collar protein FliF, partial [Bacillota bacterium]
ELMDSMPWGATDFERHVNYIRGLQGELERTIEGFEEVRRARVHVVLPRESVFISRNTPATAAVFLELRPLSQLKAEAVQGIIHLVASSVENLAPEKITVVDTQGVILSDRALRPDDEAASMRDGLQLQLQFEESLRGRLQTMLEQVLGPGNVALQVSAQMNFDDREIQTEMFEPVSGDDGLITSLHQVEEHFSGSQDFPETGAGADSNIPTYQASGTEGESTYERTESTQNAVVNRTTESWRIAPGALERLSVAVVVNGALTEDDEQMLSGVVSAALGSDPGRNDSVVVTGVPFDTSLTDQLREYSEAAEPGTAPEPSEIPLAYYIGAGAALLLALVLVLRAAGRRRRGDPAGQRLDDFEEGRDLRGADEENGDFRRQREALLETIGAKNDGLRSTAKEMAEENPAKVAQLLRTWLADEVES